MDKTPVDDEQVNIGEDVTEKPAADSIRKPSSMMEHIDEPPQIQATISKSPVRRSK